MYFGFFCCEPFIWPDRAPPKETCKIHYTQLTITYCGMILLIMIPLRILLRSKKYHDPDLVSWYSTILTIVHMFLCLTWIVFAAIELKFSNHSCWKPFTWQYFNYYFILLITLAPGGVLALGIVLCILCFPCIVKELVYMCRERKLKG